MSKYHVAYPTREASHLRIFNYAASDGLKLDGIKFEPIHESYRVPVLFCHGLQDHAMSDVSSALGKCMAEHGYSTFSINKRNSHIHYSQSIFDETSYDIKGALQYLRDEGFKSVILAGHSLGCTELLYFLANNEHSNVLGSILLGPSLDIKGRNTLRFFKTYLDPLAAYNAFLDKARKLVKEGRGDELMDLQRHTHNGKVHIATSAKTFLSYRSPESNCSALKWIGKIDIPTLIIAHRSDSSIPREEIEELRDASKSNKTELIIINSADHQFHGHMEELTRKLCDWFTVNEFN